MHNRSFVSLLAYGVNDTAAFWAALQAMFASLKDDTVVFFSDNLLTWGKALHWKSDAALARAAATHTTNLTERSVVWRTATLAWAVRHALKIEGDFAECGCYRGTTARILYDIANLSDSDRKFYLYDVFEGAEDVADHAMPAHGPDLAAEVRARFAGLDNVIITQGRVPESLAVASPERIAFLHIDMNSEEAEIGALEALFDRMSPGGVIV